jgi:gamma-glutamylcyclotransferase (GGCT)/AIG2-like uncharacterized protein YtfP
MTARCPKSKFLGKSILEGWQLQFKSVATIQKGPNFKVPVGMFEITQECENSLDVFEDFPSLYKKYFVKVELSGIVVEAMTYVMGVGYGVGPPSEKYYNVICKGYLDCGLEAKYLEKAKIYAYKNDSGASYQSTRWNKK